MPEIQPTGAPWPRAVLGWDGTTWRVMAVDAAGNLQVDVLSNANLDGALQSVGADRLQVRGEDQLFSFDEPYLEAQQALAVAAGHRILQTGAIPAGDIHVVTNIVAQNGSSVNPYIYVAITRGGVDYVVARSTTPVVGEGIQLQCKLYLIPGDVVLAYFRACALNDNIFLWVVGYVMTQE